MTRVMWLMLFFAVACGGSRPASSPQTVTIPEVHAIVLTMPEEEAKNSDACGEEWLMGTWSCFPILPDLEIDLRSWTLRPPVALEYGQRDDGPALHLHGGCFHYLCQVDHLCVDALRNTKSDFYGCIEFSKCCQAVLEQ